MIGLKISMPDKCLCCPCLHTILADGMAVRFCMAEYKEIVIMPENEVKDSPKWINFPKPDWCPLVEVIE